MSRNVAWCMVLALLFGIHTSPALAQETGGGPAAPAPALGSGNPVRDSTLAWYLLIGLSVAAVATAIELSLQLRRERVLPSATAEALERECQARRPAEAARIAQEPIHDSLLARVVLAGVRRAQLPDAGLAELLAAAENEGIVQVGRLDRRAGALAAIGSLAPLLGLVGTVQALIDGCNAVATRGDAARPADLAAVISRSLGPTLWGLVVALLAFAALAFLRARLDALADQAGRRAEIILSPLGRSR